MLRQTLTPQYANICKAVVTQADTFSNMPYSWWFLSCKRRSWHRYLYPVGCKSIPGFTLEREMASPKSISLILSGCSWLLTNITLSGLMSVCRTPMLLRACKATSSCKDDIKKNKLFSNCSCLNVCSSFWEFLLIKK